MSLKCTIRVIEARGIKAADLNGKSDPYVKLSLKGSSKVQRTRILYKTLTPIWNEEFIIDPVSQNDVLEITLWDKDAFRDDYLGELHVPLASYMNNMREEWKPIMAKQHGLKGSAFKMMTGAAPMKTQGEIHLQIFVGSGAPNSMPNMGGQMQQSSMYTGQQNPYVSQQSPYQKPPQSQSMNAYSQASSGSIPQYGLQSAPIANQNNGVQNQPLRPMQPPASAPPQYGLQSTPQTSQYPQNYGNQPQLPPQYSQPPQYPQTPQYSQQNSMYPTQYPQNTPGASIQLPPVQYPQSVQPNQYRDFGGLSSSGQYPNEWGPKPDFTTLAQPTSYGPM